MMKPKRPEVGDEIRAATFQWMYDEIIRLGKFSVNSPLTMVQSPGGTAIGFTRPRGQVRIVRLTQTGGSAGNKTTQCSFTYSILEMDNTTTIKTGVAMAGNGQRVVNAAMTAGTYGLAFFDGSSSTWKLLWADERVTQKNCT